ncbi:MAG: dihydroxyacetone kinase subunit DhaL [Kiritimatiellaeota bacterium]|nr:dihydroxyacetone kinase subunit DhaL [Kiritimatiellota bacterium]
MADLVDYARLVRILQSVAAQLKANREYLSKLDSATGDGDHGTAVSKVADAMSATIAGNAGQDIKTLLTDMGWAILATDAGSTSPLYGSLFTGMSAGVTETALDVPAFVAMLEAGVARLRQNTRAEVGSKTMIDTLVPALAAIRAAATAGQSLGQVLAAGAEAAVQGAEATTALKATFGRAKNIGDRAIGHRDPGATSMSLVFVGMKEGYENG